MALTKEQELAIARQKIANNTASEADIRNVAYADRQNQQTTQTGTTSGAFQFPSFAEYARKPGSPLSELEESLRQQQDLYQTFVTERPEKEREIRQDIIGQYPQAEKYASEQTRLGEKLGNLYTKPTSELFPEITDPTVRIALRDQRANALERQLTDVGVIQKTEQVGREDLIDRRSQELLSQLTAMEFGLSNTQDALNRLQGEYLQSYNTAYNTALQNFQASETRAAEERSLAQAKELAAYNASLSSRSGPSTTAGERQTEQLVQDIIDTGAVNEEVARTLATKYDEDFINWVITHRLSPYWQAGSAPDGKYTVQDLNNEYKHGYVPYVNEISNLQSGGQQDFSDYYKRVNILKDAYERGDDVTEGVLRLAQEYSSRVNELQSIFP